MNEKLCEKKCDYHQDDSNDYRSTLIKMELPEYELEDHRTAMRRSISRAIRCLFHLLILILVCYSVWRIHEIEKAINASERFVNITRLLAVESNSLARHRHTRAVDPASQVANGLPDDSKKDLSFSWGGEGDRTWTKPTNKDDFTQMMNSLFDKIQKMHNDLERSNFDNNMKDIFQAWLPVFDSLIPRTDLNNTPTGKRATRSLMSVAEDDSVSSSEEKNKQRIVRSIDPEKSSEETGKKSSEETVQKSNEETGKKSSEESEEKIRVTRSAESSEESDSEESRENNRWSRMKSRQYKPAKDKSIEDSSDSSESNESRVKKSRNQSNYIYLMADGKSA